MNLGNIRQEPLLHNGVEINPPEETGVFPVVLTSMLPHQRLNEWLAQSGEVVDRYLQNYGAMLFRGFEIAGSSGFNEILPAIFNEQIEYKQRTSPRHAVLGNVYTSTDHPNDQVINMHTESSYGSPWPQRICFFADVPAASGGETPIADVRKMKSFLKEEVIGKFNRKGVLYMRNIMPGVGMSWKEIYQIDNREELEKILVDNNYQVEWVSEDHLRLKWSRPAFRTHPGSGEQVWFNHAFFYSKHLLEEFILEVIPPEDLPFVSYYGDGEEIEKEVIEEIRLAYEKSRIVFPWQKGDVLLLDNMLFAHGRMPFEGERRILVAMGNPVS